MIVQKVKIRKPSCISKGYIDSKQKSDIERFLQRLYNTFLNTHQVGSEFSARDLVGEYNRDWIGTPLIDIYNEYYKIHNDHNIAYQKSARDIGWFLIGAVDSDSRMFDIGYGKGKRSSVRTYRLV